MLDTPSMKELTVAEQRYQAVLAVISDGLSISQVAEKVGVSRRRRTRGWPAGQNGSTKAGRG
jgi:transposase-like protein